MITIPMIKNVIEEIADEYQIKKVDLFGSYAKGEATKESDIDLLVEFDKPAVSLLKVIALKYKLEDRLQVDVDVIHGPIRSDSLLILDKVVPIYEQ